MNPDTKTPAKHLVYADIKTAWIEGVRVFSDWALFLMISSVIIAVFIALLNVGLAFFSPDLVLVRLIAGGIALLVVFPFSFFFAAKITGNFEKEITKPGNIFDHWGDGFGILFRLFLFNFLLWLPFFLLKITFHLIGKPFEMTDVLLNLICLVSAIFWFPLLLRFAANTTGVFWGKNKSPEES